MKKPAPESYILETYKEWKVKTNNDMERINTHILLYLVVIHFRVLLSMLNAKSNKLQRSQIWQNF